jgi:predicted phage-related endonuclease
LIKLEREFWQYVLTDTQPPSDGSESADRAPRAIYAKDHGSIVDFRENRAMSAAFADLQALREEITQRDKVQQQLRQTIQQMMGSSSRALFGIGSATWKRSKDSQHIDLDKLTNDHPELVNLYRSPKAGSRRFLIQP